jgi:hypothetical protein
MSATRRRKNGGDPSERIVDDAYYTPAWCVDRLLDRAWFRPGPWVEPGSGAGNIIRAVNARRSDVVWTAVDVRTECESQLSRIAGVDVVIADYLEWSAGRAASIELGYSDRYEVALGNPPFSLAEQFLLSSLRIARQVCLLLSYNFVQTPDRHASIFGANAPANYALPDRPSFRPDGGTDATAYAWFVWDAERPTARSTFEVLDLTPRPVRLAELKERRMRHRALRIDARPREVVDA